MSARRSGAGVSGLPQVNLLPPEVHAKRGLVRLKRWLAAAVVTALLGAVALVGMSVVAQQSADAELAAQEMETGRLVAEQREYAEVPLILSQLDRVEQARRVGMSTEILWKDYVAAIAATAPEGVSITALTVMGATPTVLPAVPADPLTAPSVANVTFTAESLTPLDTASWLEGLVTIPGFADAYFSTATLSQTEEAVFYTVSASVQINEQAYAGRFSAVEEESS